MPRSIAGAGMKWISLAALVSGALAYGMPPDPNDWQEWSNKLFRHWLWQESHKRRRKHFPNAYTDTGHPPIH